MKTPDPLRCRDCAHLKMKHTKPWDHPRNHWHYPNTCAVKGCSCTEFVKPKGRVVYVDAQAPLAKAVKAAAPGDTILVAPGTYEPPPVGTTDLRRDGVDYTPAARDVLAERQRQIEGEGWSYAHDDAHNEGELSRAALCYVEDAVRKIRGPGGVPAYSSPGLMWPWKRDWWKPQGPRRNLVKAAALLLAEIERMDRAEEGSIWCGLERGGGKGKP